MHRDAEGCIAPVCAIYMQLRATLSLERGPVPSEAISCSGSSATGRRPRCVRRTALAPVALMRTLLPKTVGRSAHTHARRGSMVATHLLAKQAARAATRPGATRARRAISSPFPLSPARASGVPRQKPKVPSACIWGVRFRFFRLGFIRKYSAASHIVCGPVGKSTARRTSDEFDQSPAASTELSRIFRGPAMCHDCGCTTL